ncbi:MULTISPECIES: dihydroorotase [Anaerotruncus]|jgi:allantoinase|uniref:dihydroorotase n=1 Tax=Anaerotruncus TaxID=244127 RepID=UPI00082FECDC|nr:MULTISPECIES: dihydroorotase [Anaerotruncus]RGX54886.1 dihydroorotase [Anaerotruncus sp. AF02-27]
MKKGDLLFQNAVVVSSKSSIPADILVRDGKIEALLAPGSGCEAAEVIDVGGRYIMPGCVDGHTHMMDPGYTDREEFTTGTMAAAVGGITTAIDHHRTLPAVYSVEPLLEKITYLSDKSCVDFGLKGGISPENTAELQAMWDAGITGFKTFTCNLHGVKAMHTAFLMRSFTEVARMDGTVLIHCEDDGICQYEEDTLRAAGRTDYHSQWEWRSKLAERVAVETVIEIAKETGCRVNIAHVSQPELLRLLHQAREEGYRTYAESCPHYFNLTVEDLEKKGPWVKFTPPMNTAEKVEELWKLFDLGYVTTIGSDHCPYPKEQKLPGEKNIWDAPNGIPGVETSLRLMLNGVSQKKTTLNRIVECMCENPAKLYGVFPKKGHIAVGADADLVLLDMDKEEVISNDRIVSKCKWSPFDGKTVKGVPAAVYLRGKLVAKDGKFVGQVGYGQFVHRIKPCI